MVGATLDWSSLWNKRCGVLVTGAEGGRGSGGGADGLMIGGVVSLLFLGETERRDLSLTAEGSLPSAPPDGVEVVEAGFFVTWRFRGVIVCQVRAASRAVFICQKYTRLKLDFIKHHGLMKPKF